MLYLLQISVSVIVYRRVGTGSNSELKTVIKDRLLKLTSSIDYFLAMKLFLYMLILIKSNTLLICKQYVSILRTFDINNSKTFKLRRDVLIHFPVIMIGLIVVSSEVLSHFFISITLDTS